jgi:hypothetical protein
MAISPNHKGDPHYRQRWHRPAFAARSTLQTVQVPADVSVSRRGLNRQRLALAKLRHGVEVPTPRKPTWWCYQRPEDGRRMEPYPARAASSREPDGRNLLWSPSRHSTRNAPFKLAFARIASELICPAPPPPPPPRVTVIRTTSSLDLEQVLHSETFDSVWRRSSPHFDDARYYSFLSSSPYSSAYAAQPFSRRGIYPESRTASRKPTALTARTGCVLILMRTTFMLKDSS